jgi:hypothetical protein
MKGFSTISKVALGFIGVALVILIFPGIEKARNAPPQTPWTLVDQAAEALEKRQLKVKEQATYSFEETGYAVSIKRFRNLSTNHEQTPYVVKVRPKDLDDQSNRWLKGGIDVAMSDFAPAEKKGKVQIVGMRIVPLPDSKKVK